MTTEVAKIDKNITDSVLERVNKFQEVGDMHLPADYSPANALKSAWLILQETKNREGKPVLQSCTKESVANALFNMVVQGLSPMKKQCDFIAYGDKLLLQREYHGTIALAKRYGGVKDVSANVIYEGDEFEYEIDHVSGRKKITSHKQKLENINPEKMKGAYATLIMEDGTQEVEIMTMAQIRASWQQGATKGQSPAHKNFPDQMAIKTVINRACKLKISASDDSGVIDEEKDPVQVSHKQTINAQANKGEAIGFDESDIEDSDDAQEVNPEPEEVEEAQIVESSGQMAMSDEPDWTKG